MPVKIQEHFKSVDPNVPDVETIDDYVGLALMYQYMFDRRTTPWENSLWDDEELQKFKIELDKIDRLYYIYHHDDQVNGQNFEMATRMNYNGKPIYIEMSAGCDFTGFECQGQGVIFISGDANLFMKLIVRDKYQKDLIYQSLADDGIFAKEQTEHDRYSRVRWSNAPMLKFLCHKTVYDYRKHLNYSSVLPKILKESVDDFIKVTEAKESYDNDWDD